MRRQCMYGLDNIVMMYFSSVSAREIYTKEILFNNFPKQQFAGLSRVYIPQYSDTEGRQLYEYIMDSVRQEGHPYAALEHRGGLNVFAALEELSEQLLVLEDDQVLCQYSRLLRLRGISRYVEEDLLVCAFLATRSRRYGGSYRDFGWDFVIGHNNVQLDRIMEKGISENHFHLFGSAPSYHLLWVYFMNHADYPTLLQLEKMVEHQRRMTREHYNRNYSEDPFAIGMLKAILIRLRLIYYLMEKDCHRQQESGMEDLFSDHETEELLCGERDILERYNDMQTMIDRMKDLAFWEGMGEVADYALYPAGNVWNLQQNRWAAGERWLMYRMLEDELRCQPSEGSRAEKYYNWFYAYLVFKQSVRNELVQTNNTVGFENFSIYTGRKNFFKDKSQVIESAIHRSICKGNVKSLEIRVTPARKAYDNAVQLKRINEIIQRQKKKWQPELKYYYVFHFTKAQDKPLGEWEDFSGCQCRHYAKRRELRRTASEIRFFRENYREQASWVLGIDACSQEIGCRPEVFAVVFRYLAAHTVEDIAGVQKVSQLRMTYHVGEDFLDMADGLRAVDEAVSFLNLRCGDRIGHGTVLGLDVRKWYEFKQNTVILAQQDYLDNVVWLYHKLVEYRIDGFEVLKEQLQQEFCFYFAEIYLHTRFGSREIFYFDIKTYYEAWKLRGDEPELYIKGRYDKKAYEREWRINRKFPEKQENRSRDEVGRLYYLYHYDWDVRKNGEKTIQKYLPSHYVEGVAAVQKAMQRDFVSRGIGIEANPSSNFAISTMRDYSEHPIVRLYNKDLTWDMGQLRECPQANISINTDDKGVFHTSLENEYALMACAMEKERDGKGNPVYNRQMVYQWIDNIREMGNMQSFKPVRAAEEADQSAAHEHGSY